MRITKLLLVAFVLSLALSSCSDNEPMDVNVKLQMQVDEDDLNYENSYQINGSSVQFTNVNFYLGDIKFETSNGTSFESEARYHLIKPGVFDFNFSIPADASNEVIDLSKITFFVGVDEETNAETEMDYTERVEGDPLGQQNPTMHWGWAGGYRFMSIDGNADTDGDGEFETQLTYHLGKNEFLKEITLNPNQKLVEGKNEFQLVFDMNKFLSNLDFSTENFTKVQPDNKFIADKLFNNYSSSFVFVF